MASEIDVVLSERSLNTERVLRALKESLRALIKVRGDTKSSLTATLTLLSDADRCSRNGCGGSWVTISFASLIESNDELGVCVRTNPEGFIAAFLREKVPSITNAGHVGLAASSMKR